VTEDDDHLHDVPETGDGDEDEDEAFTGLCWAPVHGVAETVVFRYADFRSPRSLFLRTQPGPASGELSPEYVWWTNGIFVTVEQTTTLGENPRDDGGPVPATGHHVRVILELDTVPGPEGDHWVQQLIDLARDRVETRSDQPVARWPLPPDDWAAMTSSWWRKRDAAHELALRRHVRRRNHWVTAVFIAVIIAAVIVSLFTS